MAMTSPRRRPSPEITQAIASLPRRLLSHDIITPRIRLVVLLCILALFLFANVVVQTRGAASTIRSSAVHHAALGRSVPPKGTPQLDLSRPSLYISPLDEFQIQYASIKELPNPFRILEQYKAWHSHEALERDPNNRRFIVAYYQCPVSAGNWLHYFTSAMYWGILTNRTVLWTYADVDTCEQLVEDFRNPFSPRRCHVNGTTQSDCETMLVRAPWIPAYEEWNVRLRLPATHHMERRHTQWFRTLQNNKGEAYRLVRETSCCMEVFVSLLDNS